MEEIIKDGVDYETLRSELQDLPMTWYPDLIRAMVQAAYAKKVFKVGGASYFVRNLEKGALFIPQPFTEKIERERAVQLVMDLFYALRHIKGHPRLRDLVALAKRIRRD